VFKLDTQKLQGNGLNVKDRFFQWRRANTAIMFFAMLIPWYNFGCGIEGDSCITTFSFFPEPLFFITSLEFTFGMIAYKNFRLEIIIPDVLLAICGFLLFLYLIYNLLVLLTKREEYKSRKLFPITLFIMLVVFSYSLQFFAPMLGYWLISIALLSSVVFERANARRG
jgi:hypothetical protein